MIECIKNYASDFLEGNIYTVDQCDTFGIYVLGENGKVYFDDEEELQEYFSY